MRVLILSNLYPPSVLGGYELGCAQVTEGLRGRGHELRVVTSWCHMPRAVADSPHVARRLDLARYMAHLPAEEGARAWVQHAAVCSSLPNTLAVLDEIRSFRPDVVYAWNLIGVGSAALVDLLNMSGLPWVMHLMDRGPADVVAELSPASAGLFGAGLAPYRSARVIAMSRHLVDEIETLAGACFPSPVHVVPGWADVASAQPHLPYRRDGVTRFVAAGTVADFKGTGLILEASAMLKAEGLPFHVDIIGQGEVSYYVGLAASLQIEDRVRFHGPRSQRELIAAYAGYDAFLFPTHEREPFGFAPVEAAGCGTPPIMTANCGAAERLVDEVHCLKIRRQCDDLAKAMRRVANGSVDLAGLGRAGRRLVESDLAFGRCLETIEAILREQVATVGPSRIDDPTLPALAFLKHNLSVRMQFG